MPTNPRTMRMPWTHAICIAAAILLAGAVAHAGAEPVVYHSPADDGSGAGTWTVTAPNDTLYLWLRPGDVPSNGEEEVCLDGSGDEICGFALDLVATGTLEMNAFDEDPVNDIVENFEPPFRLRLNRIAGLAPDAAPVRLGTLGVIRTGDDVGELRVTDESQAVDAAGRLIGIANDDAVAAPEPGVGLGLVTGSLVLAGLARRRRRALAAAAATLVAASSAAGDTIDFESGYTESQSVPVIVTATNEVSIKPDTRIRIGKVGLPIVAFAPEDKSTAYPATGDYFVFDRTGQTVVGSRDRYNFDFAKPIDSLSLRVFDYRVEQAALPGDWARLRVYRDYARTQLVGEHQVFLDGSEPDGNQLQLVVDQPMAEIRAATVRFNADETTTAVDFIQFSTVTDEDYDGLFGDFDNCPDFYNPSQQDVDGDGVGDFCDNCRYTPNPSQDDTNQDGEGDACGRFELTGVIKGDQGGPKTFEVFLECDARPISRLNFGVLVPFGSAVNESGVLFGDCGFPPAPPPGVPPGGGCLGPLGPTVSSGDSGGFSSDDGIGPPYHQRALYLTLIGNGPNGELCDPFEGPVPLAEFAFEYSPFFSGSSAFIFDGFEEQGEPIALATDGEKIELQSTTLYLVSPPAPTGDELQLLLQPSAGQDPATATLWDLCVTSPLGRLMERVSVGIHVEGATSTNDLRVVGCDDPPDSLLRRTCTSILGADVDAGSSFTQGPFPTNQPPLGRETLFVVLEGSYDYFGQGMTLNPSPTSQTCLATIEVASPPGTPGLQPALVNGAINAVDYLDGVQEGYLLTTSSEDPNPMPLEVVYLVNGLDVGEDYDGDGYLDSADNCVFRANDLQNNGGFRDATPNFDDDGDKCECADANGSGATFEEETPDPVIGAPADLTQIRRYLAGLETSEDIAQNCSVAESPECNIQDAVVLQRALAGALPGIETRCDAALPD